MSARRLLGWVMSPLERFYPVAKSLYMWRKKRDFDSYTKGPILLLQMGKVGSKSLQKGLEARVTDRPIYHAHFLSPERTAQTEKLRREFFRTGRQAYLQRPWQNQFLLNAIRSNRGDRRWKLITLTREPISRNISAFFENLDFVPLDSIGEFQISSNYYEINPTVVSIANIGNLVELFFERSTHDSALHFFEREIKNVFGIDVIGQGFPIEKGYEIYQGDQADLLALRLENLNFYASSSVEEFLGLKNFELVNSNIAEEKVYASLYKAFKSNIVFTADYVDRLLDSEYMRTFYTEAEIQQARSKWLRES